MKVILLQDVKKLGKKGDILEINDGYARNYILPQKLGVEANNANKNDLKLQKNNEAKGAQEQLDAAKALAEELSTKKITVTMKAGENGRVFGSVASKEISEETKKQLDIVIDKKKIVMEPIKTFGVHEVNIKLHPQVMATLRVQVEEK